MILFNQIFNTINNKFKFYFINYKLNNNLNCLYYINPYYGNINFIGTFYKQ